MKENLRNVGLQINFSSTSANTPQPQTFLCSPALVYLLVAGMLTTGMTGLCFLEPHLFVSVAGVLCFSGYARTGKYSF